MSLEHMSLQMLGAPLSPSSTEAPAHFRGVGGARLCKASGLQHRNPQAKLPFPTTECNPSVRQQAELPAKPLVLLCLRRCHFL